MVKKGWELKGSALSIFRVYLTFSSFQGIVKTMQLTSSIGARKTRVESTQPKDAPTRKQKRDKPYKPSSLPGLRLEDIQGIRGSKANLLLTSKETPAPVTIFGSSTMLWQSALLKRNLQDSLHLPHSATDLDLSPLVVRQPDWQQTCGNAYFRSSHNEALTCCLTKTRIHN